MGVRLQRADPPALILMCESGLGLLNLRSVFEACLELPHVLQLEACIFGGCRQGGGWSGVEWGGRGDRGGVGWGSTMRPASVVGGADLAVDLKVWRQLPGAMAAHWYSKGPMRP